MLPYISDQADIAETSILVQKRRQDFASPQKKLVFGAAAHERYQTQAVHRGFHGLARRKGAAEVSKHRFGIRDPHAI